LIQYYELYRAIFAIFAIFAFKYTIVLARVCRFGRNARHDGQSWSDLYKIATYIIMRYDLVGRTMRLNSH